MIPFQFCCSYFLSICIFKYCSYTQNHRKDVWNGGVHVGARVNKGGGAFQEHKMFWIIFTAKKQPVIPESVLPGRGSVKRVGIVNSWQGWGRSYPFDYQHCSHYFICLKFPWIGKTEDYFDSPQEGVKRNISVISQPTYAMYSANLFEVSSGCQYGCFRTVFGIPMGKQVKLPLQDLYVINHTKFNIATRNVHQLKQCISYTTFKVCRYRCRCGLSTSLLPFVRRAS